MSVKFLTSSFDSRRKKTEGNGIRKSLRTTGLISLTSQFCLDWFLSDISLCMRTAGIFKKDTLLSLVVLRSQGQGNNCYIWSTAPGLTRATGLKDGSPFSLFVPQK